MNEYLFWTSVIVLLIVIPSFKALKPFGEHLLKLEQLYAEHNYFPVPDKLDNKYFYIISGCLQGLVGICIIIASWCGFWLLIEWIGGN